MSDCAPRVITLGDSSVGKTSLIHRMKTDEFLEDTTPTIGAGVTSLDVEIAGKLYQVQIWDTAGQEMYRNIIPIYFKGASYAMLCFAIDDIKSFQNLESWLDEINRNADEEIGIVLVATKYDKEKQIDDDAAKRFADEHHLTLFMTSSVTGQNVSHLLEYVAMEANGRREMDDQRNVLELKGAAEEKNGCC